MKFVFIFSIFYFLFFILSATLATEAPQIIFSWQANNFFPADYEGKALVGPNTQISIAVEAIQNNKLVDLSRATIAWHIDGKFYNKGVGMKEILFSGDKLRGDDYFARAVIQNNKTSFESSIRIPVSGFNLVVKVPYYQNVVAAGSKATLEAIPYFMNVNSLSEIDFFWEIGGTVKKTTGNNQLILNIPVGARAETLTLNTSAQNTKNKLEVVKGSGKLLIK